MADNRSLGYADGINSAILRYEGAPEEEPCEQEMKSDNPLHEYNLRSLTDPAAVCSILTATFVRDTECHPTLHSPGNLM